ncbi:MAG: cyclopropane fatty acyl phospholipid synthase [Desulfobacterium sp.]|nr:cyclopropane fatty acyl phospholipid synthase [Desulfobacterium sp.]
MTGNREKETFAKLMGFAGITVNGDRPFDIRVTNDGFYQRVLSQRALGLGESYMDKWWECSAIDQFFEKILRMNIKERLRQDWVTAWEIVKAAVFNLQRPGLAFKVGKVHYDIGNDLYQRMLDKRMQYSCAYFKDGVDLDQAQEAKLRLICDKLALEPGMEVIELGCGFGGFARYAAKHHGVRVIGYTISKEQAKFAEAYCRGLPVTIKLADFREARGCFDRVVSIGIMEHVGYKNYRTYMKLASDLLTDDGIVFIHTIGSNVSNIACNPWTTKYIFPNGMLPSISQLARSMEGLFVMEDWHNFGEDYDKTLMAWHDNFIRAWPDLKKSYGERFHRMWEYYLLSSAGGFRSRSMQLWQIVMTKQGRTRPECRLPWGI